MRRLGQVRMAKEGEKCGGGRDEDRKREKGKEKGEDEKTDQKAGRS